MPERVSIEWDDLADLDLDPDNPRHEPGMPRREIIRYLVEKESVLALARDVAKIGLSPLDSFGAVATADGGYMILEGNRRLCALILLHDPSLAPATERKAFERLAQDFNPDKLNIEIVVFDDRDEANIFIERKHSGQAGGLGPRSWNATQLARHYGDKTGNQLALALLEHAIQKKMITAKQSEKMITTVTRFLSTPFVREHGLGIVTSASTAQFKIRGTQSLFELRLKKLLTDIAAGKNGATSRSKSGDRVKYAQDHLIPINEATRTDDDEQGGGTGTGDSTGGDSTGGAGSEGETDGDAGAGGGNGSSTTSGGTSTHPNNRLLLVPPTFSPSFRSERLKRILLELKAARRSTPLAAALLVRVFLESVTVTYLETRGSKISSSDKLHILVHNVLTTIDTEKKVGALSLNKAEAGALSLLKSQVSQPSYVYSAAYLGFVAHGGAFPEWSTLTTKWDEIEPILLHIAENAEPTVEV